VKLRARLIALLCLCGLLLLGTLRLPAQAQRVVNPLTEEEHVIDREAWFYTRRTAGDDPDFNISDASALRHSAIAQISQPLQPPFAAPTGFTGAWEAVGPRPIWQAMRGDGRTGAMAGRVSALAIRSSPPYTIYLGGAQGGVWETVLPTDTTPFTWTPKTDFLSSLAIGAIALAPSNEDVIYVGTGEGNLSGDSYFGAGVLKSTDGGATYAPVSGATFNRVSIAKIVVDPTNADHLYVATLRGRGGIRRTTPADQSAWGVWESVDGGVNWTPRLAQPPSATSPVGGANDLVLDPLQPQQLYVALVGQGISKTVDGGATWFSVMNGLPTTARYDYIPSRFALGLAHPSAAVSATLYVGFDWANTSGAHQPAQVWKSTDEGGSWAVTSSSNVYDYCGMQCWYNNVIAVDPTNADIAYVLGLYNYGSGSGGVYRTLDGGASWVDLGFNMHPDYHAIAIRRDDPRQVVVGNDGGVWYSANRGGRPNGNADPRSATDWLNLNEHGLQLAQFTSIAQHPTRPDQFYGGTQDNGSLRSAFSGWADMTNGDGGQLLIDPENPNYVYTTYYGVSPYRFSNGMTSASGYQSLSNGINTGDRSEFYLPWIMSPSNPQQLYLGTYRVYRTDTARGAATWQAISSDLTSGCVGAAPNGARGCYISAFGVTAGADALYVGTLEGYVHLSLNATSAAPTWQRIDQPGVMPGRPVTAIAVDRSDYRTAYVAYAGFNAATPATPGHLFKTTDAGQTWSDLSGNLPDVPINSLVLDPSRAGVLYAGTDVGVLASFDFGENWAPLSTNFPFVTVWQLDLNSFTRQIAVGTHGRGAWALRDDAGPLPALDGRLFQFASLIGANRLMTFTLALRNLGDAIATGVSLTLPVPSDTSFVESGQGGVFANGQVLWAGLTVPRAKINYLGGITPGTLNLNFTVRVTDSIQTSATFTQMGWSVTSAQAASAVGSPLTFDVTLATGVRFVLASQTDGTRSGTTLTYMVTLENLSGLTEAFWLTPTAASFATSVWDETFTVPLTQTPPLAPGESFRVGVRVAIPPTALNEQLDSATLSATGVTSPALTAATLINTRAVTNSILLVDGDRDYPDGQSAYRAALGDLAYNVWDLAADPTVPSHYLKAHRVVIWFTGAAYPEPMRPYENLLAEFLEAGGRLFLSSGEVDEASAWLADYLRVSEAREALNEVTPLTATPIITNAVTASLRPLPVGYPLLAGRNYNNQLQMISPAQPAFIDINGQPIGLTLDDVGRNAKVVFLAFPFEVAGDATDQAVLMQKVLQFFEVVPTYRVYVPLVQR